MSRFRLIQPAVAAALLALVASAGAQTLMGAKAEPASPHPGQPVTLTASFANADNPNCGVRVHWGDGQTQDFKINQTKDVPLVAQHGYAKAGSYTVMVEPKTRGMTLRCVGENQQTTVSVVKPTPVATAPAAPAAGKGPACPQGWKLNAKSVNNQSGAFTCTAKAGTAAPQPEPKCPGAMTYFHNAKRGQLGCQS